VQLLHAAFVVFGICCLMVDAASLYAISTGTVGAWDLCAVALVLRTCESQCLHARHGLHGLVTCCMVHRTEGL
jgi:hypothetical protein